MKCFCAIIIVDNTSVNVNNYTNMYINKFTTTIKQIK